VNIDEIAAAIEIDAGISLPDLRASLVEMQAEIVGRDCINRLLMS
jgi:hypothetical protein